MIPTRSVTLAVRPCTATRGSLGSGFTACGNSPFQRRRGSTGTLACALFSATNVISTQPRVAVLPTSHPRLRGARGFSRPNPLEGLALHFARRAHGPLPNGQFARHQERLIAHIIRPSCEAVPRYFWWAACPAPRERSPLGSSGRRPRTPHCTHGMGAGNWLSWRRHSNRSRPLVFDLGLLTGKRESELPCLHSSPLCGTERGSSPLFPLHFPIPIPILGLSRLKASLEV